MNDSNIIVRWQQGSDFHLSQESRPTFDDHSWSNYSINSDPKISRFLWMELVKHLGRDQGLRDAFRGNFNILNISKETMYKFKHVPSSLKHCIIKYGNQNCVRAISVLEDLRDIKKNQYKLFYKGLTLGLCIELMTKETIYLFKSMAHQNLSTNQFLRLVRTWIEYVFLIHSVPEDARKDLEHQIVIQIMLVNKISLT